LTRHLAIIAALFALAVGAIAGDGPARSNQATENDWTGVYVGGHFGVAWGGSEWAAGAANSQIGGRVGLGNPFNFSAGTGSYFQGLQAGYNFEFPSGVLLGVEGDVSFPNTLSGTQAVSLPASDAAHYQDQVLFSSTLRARLGYALGRWLVYSTGGWAWADEQLTRTTANSEESRRSFRSGWTGGAGVETEVGNSWNLELEYLFTDFGAHSASFAGGTQTFASNVTLQSVRLGLNYQLDGKNTERSASSSTGENDWAVHAQTTYLFQNDPPFTSPYVGPHSLIPGQQRETWDATFYVGVRLWSGAELWIDPEIDQGFGLSDTLGVAGFTSGEAYKVGNSYPYARLPRYFLRDTISLGGAAQTVDAAANQFPGSQTADRIVLTLGKFAVTDVFDTNKYAHDPRMDFMNWALVDTGAFDYAADAWGYTYGAAGEWYRGPWTLRAGLFDLSTTPNSEDLDPAFSQFQAVLELEHRHELAGQPGKVAITGYLSRGRMGAYAAAVALSEATGQPADMAPVREYRSRPGVAFNAEQQISMNLGVFVRAGWADGEVEPYDFTDIDRTFAAGVVLQGICWGRPGDTFGLGGVINMISGPHEAYFNAGGLGILVGDGILPNPGAEEIIEAYYSFPIEKMRATLDYQFVNDPGYNEDRGPVSILGARLHAQF
jgi:high affinity Mn2+ porin